MPSWQPQVDLLPSLATPLNNSCHSVSEFNSLLLPTDTMEERIRHARIRSGLSGAVISALIGVHRDYYHLIEQKADRIGVDTLICFCSAVHADPSYIIYGTHPPPLIPLDGDTIGDRLRSFRLSLGLSCRQFGYRMLGHQKRSTSVGEWEKGKHIPELRSLVAIGRAFGISAVSFFPPNASAPP